MLVSELMLQQTPVARVLPVHEAWLERWPTPAALAAEPSGEAVRAWGRLGYPRRALRLHAAATAILERYDGEVPGTYDELLTLPGVGDYTAAAVASFAFGRRHVVLDTNVRRVFARTLGGVEFPGQSVTKAEREQATAVLPDDEATAATWAVAVMELGALVCTAAGPALRRLPGGRPVRLAGGRLPGVRRPAAARPGLVRHRPPVPRPADGRAARRRRARCTAAGSTPSGRTRTSARAASTRWSPTGWSPKPGPTSSRSEPGRTSRLGHGARLRRHQLELDVGRLAAEHGGPDVVEARQRPRGAVGALVVGALRVASRSTGTCVTEASRTTTSCSGIASGHCLLSQIWSWPETMLSRIVSAERCQVQASLVRVCRLSRNCTSEPPIGDGTVGVM